MRIATPAFFWFRFAWNIFLQDCCLFNLMNHTAFPWCAQKHFPLCWHDLENTKSWPVFQVLLCPPWGGGEESHGAQSVSQLPKHVKLDHKPDCCLWPEIKDRELPEQQASNGTQHHSILPPHPTLPTAHFLCALFHEWLWRSSRCWSQKSWRLSTPPSCPSLHQSPTSHWPFLRSSVRSPSTTQMPSYPCLFLVSCRLRCCPSCLLPLLHQSELYELCFWSCCSPASYPSCKSHKPFSIQSSLPLLNLSLPLSLWAAQSSCLLWVMFPAASEQSAHTLLVANSYWTVGLNARTPPSFPPPGWVGCPSLDHTTLNLPPAEKVGPSVQKQLILGVTVCFLCFPYLMLHDVQILILGLFSWTGQWLMIKIQL